jgi:hypothetical protein
MGKEKGKSEGGSEDCGANREAICYYKDGTTSSKRDFSKILHRTDGPAREYSYGGREWYVDDKRHRIGGPAVEWADGTKWWYVDSRLHRIDGPAIEWANGHKEWWIDGKQYSEQGFSKLIKQVNEMSLAMKLTDPRWWVRELGEKEK